MAKPITWDNSKLLRRIDAVLRSWFSGIKRPANTGPSDIAKVLSQEIENLPIHILNQDVRSKTHVILAAFLKPENAKDGKTERIIDHVGDIDNLIRLSVRTAVNPDYLSKVIIKIGMGGSVDPVSVRLPAQILVAVRILEALRELQKARVISSLPEVHIFKANYASIYVNRLDSFEVERTTKITFSLLKQYLIKFHPDVVRYFLFDTDIEWDIETRTALSILSDILINSDLDDHEQVQRIRQMALNRGGSQGQANAMLYAAAHPLYQEDMIIPAIEKIFLLRTVPRMHYPEVVIGIGGLPEEDFHYLRMFLRERALGIIPFITPMNIQYFTRVCKLPVYYGARDGDVFIKDKLALDEAYRENVCSKNHLIRRDINAIENDTNGKYWSFLAKFKTSHSI